MTGKHKTVSGLLVIDKPKGLTSHDVVSRVRKLSEQRKVGHTGTLDPMATGVLLVCLGQATRLIEYIMTSRKQYRATLRFGIITDTLDAKGEVAARNDASSLSKPHLRKILPTFEGEIEQVPPIFSAIKKGGQPLYKRARAGQEVEPEPRLVTIHAINWVKWQFPDLTIDITCSAGTYIRSLARDIGQAAGPGAHLTALIRTANGRWTLEDAVSLAQLEHVAVANESNWQKYLHPIDEIVAHLPKVVLTEETATHVRHGRPIQIVPTEFAPSPFCDKTKADLARAYAPNEEFLAILKLIQAEQNIWRPKKVFQI